MREGSSYHLWEARWATLRACSSQIYLLKAVLGYYWNDLVHQAVCRIKNSTALQNFYVVVQWYTNHRSGIRRTLKLT